jgi:hypothetical protein
MSINNTAQTFELEQIALLANQMLPIEQIVELTGRDVEFVSTVLVQAHDLGKVSDAVFQNFQL